MATYSETFLTLGLVFDSFVNPIYGRTPVSVTTGVDSIVLTRIQTVDDVGVELDEYIHTLVRTHLSIVIGTDEYSNFHQILLDGGSATDSHDYSYGSVINDDYARIIDLMNITPSLIFNEGVIGIIVDQIFSYDRQADDFGTCIDSFSPVYGKSNQTTAIGIDRIESFVGTWDVDALPIARYLPEKFRLIPAWSDLISVLYDSVVKGIQDATLRLRQIRHPQLFEIELADRVAVTLGYLLDLDKLTSSAKQRLIESLTSFYERKGTRFTYNFLNYVTEINFQVFELYTQDYVDFLREPGGELVPNGTWYLTNHVDVEYDATLYPDVAEVQSKFYQIAPVPLVIRQLVGLAQFESTARYSSAAWVNITVYASNELYTP